MNLTQILKEIYLNNDCGCGCGGCKLTPTLTESKTPISENLQYHINKGIMLSENEFRIGSKAYMQLFTEARSLYKEGKLEVGSLDKALLETDLGEFGLYEGENVPLDLPMIELNPYQPILEDIKIYGKVYEGLNIEDSYQIDKIDSTPASNSFIFADKHGIQRRLDLYKGNSVKILWFNPTSQKWTTEDIPSKYEDDKVMNTIGKILVKIILPKYGSFYFIPLNQARYRLFRALIYNNLDTSKYKMDFDETTKEIEVSKINNLDEAEFRGKDVQLNKPKRGGSKAYYVYVKDPKTKKVKKVSFGSGGLRAKINNKDARTAFAKRHNCDQKKDRTKAGYWSCNLPRYAKALGLGNNMNTYW